MARWQFVLTDSNYVPQGEILNANDRVVANPLNKLDTASFRVRLDNPLVDQLGAEGSYLKAYRDGVLRFFGPIISSEETGDETGASVAVNAVGAGWIMTKRLVGRSSVGTVTSVATDRAIIARNLFNEINASGETGIQVDAGVSSGSAITYTAGPYAKMYDVVTELATAYDGFDWRVFPVENWVNSQLVNNKVGLFFAAPIIGIQQPNAIFEWGGGRYNMKAYTISKTRDAQANTVYHIASPGPDAPGYPVVSAIDATSISNYRLLEDLAQADLLATGLRQQLVAEHVRLRANPRKVISMTPHIDPANSGRVPAIGTDYDVGDFVRSRIMYRGSTRLDAMVRVWGATFEIDPSGVERVSTLLAADS